MNENASKAWTQIQRDFNIFTVVERTLTHVELEGISGNLSVSIAFFVPKRGESKAALMLVIYDSSTAKDPSYVAMSPGADQPDIFQCLRMAWIIEKRIRLPGAILDNLLLQLALMASERLKQLTGKTEFSDVMTRPVPANILAIAIRHIIRSQMDPETISAEAYAGTIPWTDGFESMFPKLLKPGDYGANLAARAKIADKYRDIVRELIMVLKILPETILLSILANNASEVFADHLLESIADAMERGISDRELILAVTLARINIAGNYTSRAMDDLKDIVPEEISALADKQLLRQTYADCAVAVIVVRDVIDDQTILWSDLLNTTFVTVQKWDQLEWIPLFRRQN